jgi:hypothetical protein
MEFFTSRMAILPFMFWLMSISLAYPEPSYNSATNTVEHREYPTEVRHLSNRLHGTVMGLTVALVLPLGALSWRLLSSLVDARILLKIHITCQLLGLLMLVVGFGSGIWTAITHDEVWYSLARIAGITLTAIRIEALRK